MDDKPRMTDKADKPRQFKTGQSVLLEANDEKWLAEVVLASENGVSLMLKFNGMIGGHVGMIALLYKGNGSYISIIDESKAMVKPLPKNWFRNE